MTTKYFFLLSVILSVFTGTHAQTEDLMTVPKPENVKKVSFAESNRKPGLFTSKSLLALLPTLVPGVDVFYFSDTETEDGTITLKNGKVLEWSAATDDSLYIKTGKGSGTVFFSVAKRIEKQLTLPKPEDISRVSISPGGKKWFTSESLVRVLPRLVHHTGFYLGKQIQHGTIELKDGTVLRWTASGADHIVLHSGKNTALYAVDYLGDLSIPKTEDIGEISMQLSEKEYFTEQSLRDALPRLEAGGTFKVGQKYQYGVIEDKKGTILNWRADSENTLMLYGRSGETYFHLPSQMEKSAAESTPAPTQKMLFRGSVMDRWFEMTLVREGDTLTGDYFYTRPGQVKRIKLMGTIGSDGNCVLREVNAVSRRTGEFHALLTENPETKDLTLTGYWNDPRKTEEFQSSGVVLEFTDKRQIQRHTLAEKNKPKRFSLSVEYPEIIGGNPGDMVDFNSQARNLAVKPMAKFKRQNLAVTAEELKRQLTDGDLTIDYGIEFASDDLISLQFSYSDFADGMAHAMFYFQNLNYDLKNKRKLKLSDLFKRDAKYLDFLSQYCLKELQKRPPINGTKLVEGDWAKGAEPDPENFRDWNLTRNGLLVTFGVYQIAPYPAGVNYVLVPYSKLKEIADPDGMLMRIIKTKGL